MARNFWQAGLCAALLGVAPQVAMAGTITVQNLSSVTVPQTNVYPTCFCACSAQYFGSVAPGSAVTQAREAPIQGCTWAEQVGFSQYPISCSTSNLPAGNPSDPAYLVVTWTGDDGSLACTIQATNNLQTLAPAAPTSLSATANGQRIALLWSADPTGVIGFHVYRSTGGAFSLIGTVTPPAATYSDLNLASSTTYTYQVTAFNLIAESADSNQASATTFSASSVPYAPSELAAVGDSDNSGGHIQVTWFDNSNNETSVHVERKTGAGSFLEIAVLAANTMSYRDSSVSFSQTYTYRVRACNGSGCSGYSNSASAHP